MCRGVGIFESNNTMQCALAGHEAMALLQQEMRQFGLDGHVEHHRLPHGGGDGDNYSVAVYNSSVPSVAGKRFVNPRLPVDGAEQENAAPAGLAIVASLSSELIRSPYPGRLGQASGDSNRASRGGTNNVEVRVHHSQRSASRRSTQVAGVATSQSSVQGSSSKSGSTRRRVRSAGAEEAKSRSIFCSVFSPPAIDDQFYIRHSIQEAALFADHDFMDYCLYCKRPLGSGKDIYIYRGDRAFCSNECRCHHIVEDERSQERRQQPNCSAGNKPDHCSHTRTAVPSPFIPVLG